MRRGLLLAALAVSATAALPAAADTTAYAVSFNTLYRLELATGRATPIGEIGFNDVEGLAMSPEGVLYGIADANKTLITIDTNTGHGIAVGGQSGNTGLAGTGVGQFDALDFGLAFSCDGQLFASSDTSRRLYRLDRQNGRATLSKDIGKHLTGLAANGDALYGIGVGGDEFLYRIDPQSLQITQVGALSPGLAYADGGLDFGLDGVLYGLFDYQPLEESRPSDVVRIDLNTGRATVLATTLAEMEGLAMAKPASCRGPGTNNAPHVEIPASGSLSLLLQGLLMAAVGLFAVLWRGRH